VETQTTETPQEIAARLAAVERHKDEHQKWLDRWPANTNDPEKVRDYEKTVQPWFTKAYTEKPAPAYVADGPKIAQTLRDVTDLKTLQQTFPEGSAEARALNDSIIQATNKHLATLAPKPVPGAYGWDDYDKSDSASRLTPDAKREIRLRVQHAGGDPQAATLAADALQTFFDTRPHPLTQPALEYDEDYQAAAVRGLTRLGYDAATIAALKADGLFHPGGQKLMGLLWQVGQG